MATVRIYKVAELLGTTSQEVVALLKRDHGIEVKGASSTIEEVVGRQFVERMARQRGVSLPGGDMFAETPVHKSKKPTGTKKPEPPKPVAPALPPPRLVRTLRPKPAEAPEEEAPVEAPEAVEAEPAEVVAAIEVEDEVFRDHRLDEVAGTHVRLDVQLHHAVGEDAPLELAVLPAEQPARQTARDGLRFGPGFFVGAQKLPLNSHHGDYVWHSRQAGS